MMTWYISMESSVCYKLLDDRGTFIGRIERVNAMWFFKAPNGAQRKLFRNLNKSLLEINSNVKWMEQLTHFEEVK